MIDVESVSKRYHTRSGVKVVLDQLDLTLRRGQRLGVMGRNGAGKSTLTRIISGIEYPDGGKVRRDMSVSWPLGFFGAFQTSLSGADNARFVARIYGVPSERMLAEVEAFAELGDYLYMPLSTYSSGMSARLSFGVSLAVRFDCYIVDEITGVGDYRFAERCHSALMERCDAGGALLMISHDVHTLETYCNCGAILEGGKLRLFDSIPEMYEAYHAA
jgi:capsular polysaccharide transport system ATP-binding protein